MKYDLHVHSSFSDGLYDINYLIKLAKINNIDKIAITDHDDLSSIKYDNIIHGIELSVRSNNEDIHLLGYFKNLNNIDKLNNYLLEQKENRKIRIYKICELLKLHYNILIDPLEIINQKGSVGRPHIASQIAKKLNIPMNEAFNKYLTSDSKAYISSSMLKLEEGAKLLHEANAIVVLAHPVLYKKNDIKDLIKYVDGIEAIYPENTNEDTKKYIDIAKNNSLIITAGSDFHGDNKHKSLGYCTLDDVYLNDFLNKLNN